MHLRYRQHLLSVSLNGLNQTRSPTNDQNQLDGRDRRRSNRRGHSLLTDGFFHERVVNADWRAVYAALHAAEPTEHSPLGLAYFAIFELGRGLISIYLYSLMRSCCGPGPKTAVFAGIVGAACFLIDRTARFIPLGFYSRPLA